MPEDRDTVERMQREVSRFPHFRLEIVERVWDGLMREYQPHDVDKGAARKPEYDELGHLCGLFLVYRTPFCNLGAPGRQRMLSRVSLRISHAIVLRCRADCRR